MKIQHFIFDLDGTLIDTENAVLKTWKQTLKEYGYDFSLEALNVVLGVTTEIGLQRLNAKVDKSYMSKWQKNYTQHAKETAYFAGVEKMLTALKANGYSLGAVSSRCREEYKKFFSNFGLEKILGTVILEEDTQKHKPHPEPLYKYLELTGAKKEECIYIGDMPGDIQCANHAGILSGLAAWNGSNIICDEAKMVFHHVNDVFLMINSRYKV